MDENSGTTSIFDSSGSGNTGTMDASMTEDDWVGGKFGSALQFDGSDDDITIATTNFTKEAGSVSAWVKVDDTYSFGQHIIFAHRNGSSDTRFYLTDDHAGSNHNFDISFADGTNKRARSSTVAQAFDPRPVSPVVKDDILFGRLV